MWLWATHNQCLDSVVEQYVSGREGVNMFPLNPSPSTIVIIDFHFNHRHAA